MTLTTAVATQRARLGLVTGLIGSGVGSWLYIALVASRMDNMSSALAMPMTANWTLIQGLLMALMWSVMMAAMMLPSAIPMVAMYDRLDRGAGARRSGSTVLFVAGYGVMWAVFSMAATALQWRLHNASLVNGMGVATQGWFAGALLIMAGFYQFTPLKRRSLTACRTPMGFLMTSWREGRIGALRMGIGHGKHCLGCCWSLMILLFVLGVMNLAWVVILSALVLAEKLTRHGEIVAKLGGATMMAWGAFLIL